MAPIQVTLTKTYVFCVNGLMRHRQALVCMDDASSGDVGGFEIEFGVGGVSLSNRN